MDGAHSLRLKGLTGLQYDVLMLLVESSRYGNKVEIERDVIALKVKASAAKVSNALKVLEERDVLTRLGMGYLMFNPDIILVGEARFRHHWRDEYRSVREMRMSRKQRKTTAKKATARVLELVA